MSDPHPITQRWADLLIEELVRCGVELFAVAPGSRSTPLVTAVARNERARSVIHFDERGTAFFALGYGRATGRPAAWITTSGTAVANGMPAVVEAASDGVPLLLLTADRPPELRDTGANQTIDQVKLFGDYTRWFADLPAPTADVPAEALLTTVDQAVYRTRRAPGGPVHLNAMFRKPLEPTGARIDLADDAPALLRWKQDDAPFTTYAYPGTAPDEAELDRLAARMQGIERGLVVAGRLHPGVDGEAIRRAANALGWPLVAEVTSQLRLGTDGVIRSFDALLADETFRAEHEVEAVLHLGALGPSKRLAHHVHDSRPALHALVQDAPARIDEHHRVTHRIEARPDVFCNMLAAHLDAEPTPSRWLRRWQDADARATAQLAAHLDDADALTEPFVARTVTRHLPEGHGLVVASSMPVRDVNRFAAHDGSAAPVAANRGASGIDGTVATAAGFARGLGRPVTLLIGDLALLHDLNSLHLLSQIGEPVTVVAVNNDGGGIFHFLPIAEHEDVFEPLFGTPHGLSFEHAATMFGLRYVRAETPAALTDAYRDAVDGDGSTLIEVPTDRHANRAFHAELESAVAAALAERRAR